jgi:hypothetical protein
LLRSLQEIQPDNGRRLWRRPRPKLGCGAKERERERERDLGDLGVVERIILIWILNYM